MTLKADDLKKYNPPSKHHCKTEDDFKAALNKLKVFLHACMGKEGARTLGACSAPRACRTCGAPSAARCARG